MASKKPTPALERAAVRYRHDQAIWERIEETVRRHDVPIRDLVGAFAIYARRANMTRFLARYELYKRIAELPGSIVECGVFRGEGLLAWAKFLEIFHGGDRTRRVIGFDNFAGFASLDAKDGAADPSRSKVAGGYDAGRYYDELLEHVETFHRDSFVPHARRIELVAGDIVETAPAYVAKNPGLRISLLHLDLDLYAPTLAALQALYPRVVVGGLVVFDEYGLVEWPGESQAVEEYFGARRPRIAKFPFSSTPGGFFVKEAGDA